jgi:hypothetical protein
MPRPFVQLVPEPVVPISGAVGGGGSSGVIVEDDGVPTANNPHTTLNFTGDGVTASDAGGGVATIDIPGSAAGFTDNATALRTRQNLWIRRDENLTSSTSDHISFSDIPELIDSGANRAGAAIASIADKVFFTDGFGDLYGLDLLTKRNVAGPNQTLFEYPSSAIDLVGVRGLSAEDGATDYLFAVLQGSPVQSPWDVSYSSATGLVWVALDNFKGNTVLSFNSSTSSAVSGTDVSEWLNYPVRIITDNTYAYVCSGYYGDKDAYVVIISQATGGIVGVCQVSGVNSVAQDMTLDGAGNLYVASFNSESLNQGTIQKFSILAAIAAYPSTVSPTVVTPVQQNYYSVAYDPVTSQVFAGTNSQVQGPAPGATEFLISLDPTTLVATNTLAITADNATFGDFEFLLAAFGSIWVGTYGTTLLRIDPTTFPAGTPLTAPVSSGGCVTAIPIAGSSHLWEVSADATHNTVFVGDFDEDSVYRVSSASNTLVSTITLTGYFGAAAAYTPGAIWVATGQNVQTYTTPVGTETFIETIEAATAELVIVSGQSPNVIVDDPIVYQTSIAEPVRACLVASGGSPADPNYGSTLVFAFSSTDGHIYLVDPSGVVHDAYNTGDTPGAMFVDDAGFLWAAYTTGNKIAKLSVDLTSYTLSLVTTISAGISPLDMVSDGRYARTVASVSGVPTLNSWDLLSESSGPTSTLPVPSTTISLSEPRDLFYDATANVMWVADQGFDQPIFAINATSHAGVFAVSTSTINNASRRVIGDASNIYVSDAFNNSQYVLIINKTTGNIVGTLDTGGGGQGARDQTLDGSGNIYVVWRNGNAGNIQKFSIAAALAAYPTPVTATVTSPTTRAYHVCAYDPVTSTVFGGTQNTGSGPNTEYITQLNTTTLAEINTLSFVSASGENRFQFMLAATGSLWTSTYQAAFNGYTGNLFRVNPSTFPSPASVTNIVTASTIASGLSYDSMFNTILVGDEDNTISRINVSTNLMVSNWSLAGENSSAVITPNAIWITEAGGSSRGIWLYTTGIGSEAPIQELTSVAVPTPFTGRLAWDGVSIYVALDPYFDGGPG